MSSEWIYIVEDDESIREMEQYALENSGFKTRGFGDSRSFFTACEDNLPGLVILDIMLAGENGLTILKVLRASPRTALIPVMMVTAKDSELDKVRGLDLGADDYLAKPFGVLELVSRTRALLRRSERLQREEAPWENIRRCGPIVMKDERRQVLVEDNVIELTYKEYELLKILLENQGRVLTREVLLDRIWGYQFEGGTRTVDVHIKTLRQKMGDGGAYIKTVRGVGYKAEENIGE
jgi:two-component system alkaline phosphatase synthesis response regulator PhoP